MTSNNEQIKDLQPYRRTVKIKIDLLVVAGRTLNVMDDAYQGQSSFNRIGCGN